MTGIGAGLLWLMAAAAGLGLQYLIIRTAVYHALVRLLRDASRQSDMREGFDIPRQVDQLTTHLAKVVKRLPPE
uniref:hypothetical protein n=1 Tax=Paractinoplanes polyasparticus TaxID=2856853 RepID=UPI001C84C4DB|nr:hypothetical protein [Actinoplanes polyasparticus]